MVNAIRFSIFLAVLWGSLGFSTDAVAGPAPGTKRPARIPASAETSAWLTATQGAKAGQPAAIRSMLSMMKNRDGLASAEFTLQIADVYARHPLVLLGEAKTFFAGDMKCLAYWLVPVTEEVEYSEIRRSTDRALASPGGRKSEDLKKFSTLLEQYHTAMLNETSFPMESCARFLFGPLKN